MRIGHFSCFLALFIFLLSTSGATAIERPTYEIIASGSSVSLKQAERDFFHLFSKDYQRKRGKMHVLSSSIKYTKLDGMKVSLVKARLRMARSHNPEWVVFAVWPIEHQKYRGNVFVFKKDINHRKFLIKKVRDDLKARK